MSGRPRLGEDETRELLDWHADVEASHDDDFEAAKELVTRLGAHRVDDDAGEVTDTATARVGFWTPDVVDAVPEEDVYLEVLTPEGDVDPAADEATATFSRERVPLRRRGEFHWGVVAGLRPGTREQLGSLYRLSYRVDDGWETVADPLAHSVPFGAYAPAEFYDLVRLDETRADREYFESLGGDDEAVVTSDDDGLPRIDPATSMLELHPRTATESKSLGGLARVYEEIARKERAGEELTPSERNFAGYDAVQLMPVEPITQNPERHHFWEENDGHEAEAVEVRFEHPDLVNWGYDIVVSAFSATNPAILETGRPDELVDFIAACHDMPRPIRVVFDVALGHADNGALPLLNDEFFAGPGMYGQELEYRHPVVRAALLEMQRRKMDFGADGIRVDGAQDFTNWDEEAEEEYHDDAFLAEMDRVVQEVGGQEYRPWMIYEDGRPWPRGDWELASTYRELIDQHPHSYQWSPITFAHNKPALLTFWASKWWRVTEVANFGENWITGVANHDTLRRGTQQAVPDGWEEDPINPYLGETPPDIIDEAYDNPATDMLVHCALPGVPMDFVNANHRAPWAFVRDTDETWNVKVVADEANFVKWHVTDELYADERFFENLKDLGFESPAELDEFVHSLRSVYKTTDYDLKQMADLLSVLETPFGDDVAPEDLERFGYAWVEDVAEFANLGHWRDEQDDARTAFELRVREFRHDRPWLARDVDDEGDEFGYRHPTDGHVLYYALRESPDGGEQVLFAGNMEGTPVDVSVETLAEEIPNLPTEGWKPTLVPDDVERENGTYTLTNARGVVWTREP